MKKLILYCLLLLPFNIFAQNPQSIPGKIEAESYTASQGIGTENTADEGGGQNVGWIDDGDWMDYQVHAPSAGYYTFKFRIANAYSPEASISLKTADGTVLGNIVLPQTGGMQGWQTVNMIARLPAGDQTLRVFVQKGVFNFNWFEVAASRTLTRLTEAESYDSMFEVRKEATGDTGGGENVGYIDDGDWLDYNIKTLFPGTYTFNFRVSNAYGNGLIEIKSASGAILGHVNVPQTGGWQTYTTISTEVELPIGSQVIRLYANRGAYNLNWFEAISHEASRISGVILPGKIEAENFDAMRSVGTETAQDAGGGQNVSNIQDGSWMDYKVHFATAGVYTFKYRIANSCSPEATLVLQDTAGTVFGKIVLPQTGGWQGWRTVNMIASMPSGNQTLRVFAEKGGFNFNWFEVVASRPLLGKTEAETFDVASDVRIESITDVEPGETVSYIDDGDYLDYNVKVGTAGIYTFNFRVSNSYGNGHIEIQGMNGAVLGVIDIPQTGGWQNWATVRTTATLPAGSQRLRFFAVRGSFNFNWFEVIEGSVQGQSLITFAEITPKNTADNSFDLVATSTNLETPVTFSSSNSAIVSVSNATGIWKATILAAGQVSITASQAGNNNFIAATNVVRQVTITQSAVPTNPTIGTKIPIDPKRWYQLTNAANGLDGFFDGETQVNVQTGWGKVINYYEAWYPLKEGEEMTLESIRFFDYTGSTADQPMVLSVITDQWQRIPVATFTGEIYNGWVGPYPDRHLTGSNQFKLDAAISNARYLILTIPNTPPTEIEFYGTYKAPDPSGAVPRVKNIRLRDMLGVNAYEWNFQDGAHAEALDETKMTAAQSFTGIRHYMDWEKLESTEGVFSYNPTLSGSWNYDLIYERCKAAGMEVLACLKTQPVWMQNTYPESERDAENVPVRYGKNFADPLSYIEQARVAFQYAARYGSNVNVNPELLSVSTTPRWYGDYPNTIRIGLDLIKYIECDNERDKWWKGRKGYQTAREYAANLSAFYDGHKNTMGAAIGVKNADPNMKVVIAGLVTGADYIKGMVDWCKEFRGYNPDGTVNLCWDIVNFHLYTDDASSNQSGTSTRGAAPEVTNAEEILQNFVSVSREYSKGMPVWITEAGYDVNQSSPLKAIPIGNKSALQTQADWLLRTSLFSARNGIEKMFYFQMYDDNGSGGMFGSSGLLNNDQSRRPSADYFLQANKLFGNYVYKETLNDDPIVDRYELDGKSVFILTVPDEIGRTAPYSLDLRESGVAKVYTPVAGSANMDVQELTINDHKVTVTATETPVFVIASAPSNARMAATETARTVPSENKVYNNTINVYPNPSQDYIMIDLDDFKNGDTEIRLIDASLGRLYKQQHFNKTSNASHKKLSISSLPTGTYILEIKQGNTSVFRKVVKGN